MVSVSIIVPVYNVEKYIVRCLDSIKHQTMVNNIELILVDDCGNDKSMYLAKKYLSEQTVLNYKILCHSKNKGLSEARNTGISEATGDYLFFLDSDDEISNDCIECLIKPTVHRDYDIVVGNYVSIGGKVECELRITQGEIIGNDTILKEFINNSWYAMVWNKLYRRNFIYENMLIFKQGVIHEDELFSFNVSLYAESMYIVLTETYKYYINSESIMNSMVYKKHYNSWAIILLEMVNRAKAIGKYEDYNVYNYIELLKTNFTCEAFRHLNKKDFWEYYCILSKETWNPIKYLFQGKLNYKRVLKDLCFYLPNKLGFYYLCIWYKLTLKDL